ncbi:hypothetical protein ElyMa_004629300 [Elysia marginata]|uniref:Uncharacterized protein n=1 Tax=Elysia marginata TaxID=1093978 RepID=A0AAV4HYL4_9GAST|nr:hypothetical protein ElyMa_004629300 [Elysia marginata]
MHTRSYTTALALSVYRTLSPQSRGETAEGFRAQRDSLIFVGEGKPYRLLSQLAVFLEIRDPGVYIFWARLSPDNGEFIEELLATDLTIPGFLETFWTRYGLLQAGVSRSGSFIIGLHPNIYGGVYNNPGFISVSVAE